MTLPSHAPSHVIDGLQNVLGGRFTMSRGVCAEHGIGRGKIRYLENELGKAVNMMRQIKKTLDPNNIIIPGKAFRLDAHTTRHEAL